MGIILAIRPVYIKDKGDCTMVLKEGTKEILIEKPIDIVIEDEMALRMVDLKVLKKKIKEITKMKKNYPLYPTNEEMLVLVKLREAKVVGDRAYGYINNNYIDSVYNGVIITKGGEKYKLQESEKTFNRRRGLCELIEEEFQRDSHLRLIYGNSSKYAEEIKRDIVELANKYR
ncbi:hypothetical protein [Clostridium cylindrosporum]|uniref:Uncharacterized protein n=1 Tax=Clostridium cylindrosporum DSM 605 TaxID=1121307 RepID=A0A0J8DFD9_CLOCY|nr:hypothetical protein [Clostridium cylindrosporum]KMT22898.1 hypothetical protein CLCY_5c01370 [Clostridium cylindrosporum DSM 605]